MLRRQSCLLIATFVLRPWPFMLEPQGTCMPTRYCFPYTRRRPTCKKQSEFTKVTPIQEPPIQPWMLWSKPLPHWRAPPATLCFRSEMAAITTLCLSLLKRRRPCHHFGGCLWWNDPFVQTSAGWVRHPILFSGHIESGCSRGSHYAGHAPYFR